MGQYILEVTDQPCICSPLSVVEKSSGKKQLVVNMRHLNQFLQKQRFKYEDLCIAMMLFEEGEFMFTFVLKSGYHHGEIGPTIVNTWALCGIVSIMCLQLCLLGY